MHACNARFIHLCGLYIRDSFMVCVVAVCACGDMHFRVAALQDTLALAAKAGFQHQLGFKQ